MSRSYVTSSGPKQAGQTYAIASGWVCPQFRHAIPVIRSPVAGAVGGGEVLVGGGRVGVVTIGLQVAQ
jgi:hypothetical protein